MPQKHLRIFTSGKTTPGYDQAYIESKLASLCKFTPDADNSSRMGR